MGFPFTSGLLHAQQVWNWALDYVPNVVPPREIGTEGAWSYGYDANTSDELSAPFEFVPFPIFGNHIWGGGDYHFSGPNPALLAKQANGMIIHTAPNAKQPVVVRWTATRAMTVNITGRAYKFAFDENNGRTQEFYVRKNGESPLTFGTVSDATLDSGAPLAFAATTTVQLGDTIDTFAVRTADKIQGFLGIELVLHEVLAGAPTITVHPQAADALPGSTASLSVTASGDAPLAYQWHRNGNDIAGADGATLMLPAATVTDAGVYGVRVSNGLGTAESLTVVVEVNPPPSTTRHDLRDDFRLSSNPTDRGWQYSRALRDGGGRVRPITPNWNEPDFGSGQLGWEGPGNAPHAGWARRIDNGNPTPTYDDPVGAILTHGPTSAVWKSPPGDPNRFANIRGDIYNIRKFGRSGTWRIFKNSTEITSGTVDDNSGTSTAPKSFVHGSAGPSVLEGIPYQPGDAFRLEILHDDFAAVNFTIETTASPPDPLITVQPQGRVVSPGTEVTLRVVAEGTAPLTYQWKRNGVDLPGRTADTLVIPFATETADYQVLVTSAKGSRLSSSATVVVADRSPGEPWDLVADFQPGKVPAVDVGPDGSWSYGYDARTNDDVLAPLQFVPMPLYAQHVIGNADYHISAPNPGSIAPRGSGLYIHTSDQPNQQAIILRWTARRPMRIHIMGSAYKYEVEGNGRTQDFFLRKNSGPLLASGTVSDDTVRNLGTELPIAAENISMLAGDFIDLFVSRHPGSVQGFLGVELVISEVLSDVGLDFALDANPTATGWQYSESLGNGGGPVGGAVPNWNQPDFGPGQTGWQGVRAGAHAGWARRIDNGNGTPTYDDPVDTVLTHGPTSVKWTAPVGSGPGHLAIRGGLWNIRHFGRSGTWKLWKNDTQLISEGAIDDANGTSLSPRSYASGSGGAAGLQNIPYQDGDSIRLEVLNGDFVGVRLSISTYKIVVDPPTITLQPRSVVALVGAAAVYRVEASGPPPLAYQWKFNDTDIPGATTSMLQLGNVTASSAGTYHVVVSNPGGSVESARVTLTVDDTFSGPARQQSSDADGLLVLEAENFDRSTPAGRWEWIPIAGGVEATPNEGRNVNVNIADSPRLDYKVLFVRPGIYSVWLRGLGDSAPGPSANDSVNLGIDFSLPNSSDRITGFPEGAGRVWSRSTLDNVPATLEVVSGGLHVLNVWMREDGFVLDKILITSNPNLIPTGDGPPESGTAGVVLKGTLAPNGRLILTWNGTARLEEANGLAGPWSEINGASSPHDVPVLGAARFFRLRE